MKTSIREERIRKITHLYYSRKDVQKAIFEFSKNREIVPRYFEGFGKRPDSFDYIGDVFELVKKGATSFNCSEELWKDPLEIETGMSEEQLNDLRIGWDLLIDIDSKYIDYSKISAELIIKVLRFHGIKNLSVKFSGSKGFHIIVPWKAFPKQIGDIQTKDMFPGWPKKILQYLIEKTKDKLIERISNLEKPSKYVKDFQASKEVMPDLILASSRHLFRMPYSLHEKTALASIVLDPDKIADFDMQDADPLKAKVKNFYPDAQEGEARELLLQVLDWSKQKNPEPESRVSRTYDFKPVKLTNLSDDNFPPCIKNILKGMADGKKRALFILINFFRSLGIEREETEKRIYDWNAKNKPPLRKGYVDSKIQWSYRSKPIMPPNCKEYYQGIGVCEPDNFCSFIKNPVSYTIKKNFSSQKKGKTKRNRKN